MDEREYRGAYDQASFAIGILIGMRSLSLRNEWNSPTPDELRIKQLLDEQHELTNIRLQLHKYDVEGLQNLCSTYTPLAKEALDKIKTEM